MNTWPQGQPDYGIPDDPFHPPEETPQPKRRRADRRQPQEPLPEAAHESAPLAPQGTAGAQTAAAQSPSAAAPCRRAGAAASVPQEATPFAPWATPDFGQTALEPAAFAPEGAAFWPMTGRQAQPVVTVTADGSQFTPPAHAEIPDWLRTAQQINPPMRTRPPAPRVQAAPRQEYADEPAYAPTPEPEWPARDDAPERVQRTYHENARAEAAYVQSGYARREESRYGAEETDSAAPEWVKRIPWLGIVAFLTAMTAIVVWTTGLNYEAQTRRTLEERARLEQSLCDRYPLRYQELIEQKAGKYNLSPAFVAAIMLNESSFRPDATSAVDARGLMQLMDDTASWIHGKLELSTEYDFQSLYDPETNVEFGCWYLHFLSERFRGDPILVAAAFHAGQGEVQNWLNSSSYSADHLTIRLENLPEGPTKQYVTRVLAAYAAYKRLYYGG